MGHTLADVNVTYQAMHMSDGIVNAPVSVLFGVLALVALGLCAWRAREELDERTVPLAPAWSPRSSSRSRWSTSRSCRG